MNTLSSSLQSRYEALEAERRRTWSSEALAGNIAQREALVRAQPETTHVKVGDVLSPHVLLDADGTTISLDDLTSAGPAVVVFFRFAGCPACNIALPYYAETLAPVLKAAGIPLVAVSSQPFPELDSIRTRNDLPFPILNDPELALSHALGITYLFDESARDAAIAKGDRSEALNGTSRWELPKPTILVLGPGRTVSFIDISPDWMRRTETSVVLTALGLKNKGVYHAA
ncbi:alkyl hydroperoxide reductase [Acetobacter malorum DSM 14337]|uniref:thioredoxin-dependent peroxiredoxin n=1 Tax=Acetobacter malorum DSM 14337 TaxID=1307910 RepID=A0ABQ0PT33_9PROT|nr:peroxiredoxin-like family protein [Acetobacter malorum]KXV04929.1 alkyl hydroperoxide reductase [Acetobacter malorum]GBQ80377.1 alkyl hydroperoxide reductase [Acetobacter malorum DSM 14337]